MGCFNPPTPDIEKYLEVGIVRLVLLNNLSLYDIALQFSYGHTQVSLVAGKTQKKKHEKTPYCTIVLYDWYVFKCSKS
jgi:hypothetical protein